MKISMGCDHGGFDLKEDIKAFLTEQGHEVEDFGCYGKESCDYPMFGEAAARAVACGECEKGIVICTTGIGISIAANKVKGIRAAVCSEPYSAEMTRRHNDANIIAFGARVVGVATAERIVDAFLEAEYEGDRHAVRVDMIKAIEEGRFDV